MPSNLVLLDNTVLTNFALVERPDLVLGLWGDMSATTPAVMAEYRAGVVSRDLPLNAWENLPILSLMPSETALAKTFSSALGAGERTCLAVAIHRGGMLASDDADARRTARNYGVPLTGSLGILALNTSRGVIKLVEGNKLLEYLIDYGYRSPVSNLDSLIDS